MKDLFRFLPLLLLILALLTSGCSHSYPVAFGREKVKGDTVTVATVNRRLAGRNVTIMTRDGRELSVSGVFLSQDSCLFTDTAGESAYLPRVDIQGIRHVDRFSAAVGGFGLGMLGGFAVGMGILFLVVDRGNADSGMGASLLGIGTTVAGSLIGLGVGAAQGTIIDYTLPVAMSDSTQR